MNTFTYMLIPYFKHLLYHRYYPHLQILHIWSEHPILFRTHSQFAVTQHYCTWGTGFFTPLTCKKCTLFSRSSSFSLKTFKIWRRMLDSSLSNLSLHWNSLLHLHLIPSIAELPSLIFCYTWYCIYIGQI